MSNFTTAQIPMSSQAFTKPNVINYPWVFYVRVKRRKWFTNFWKSRGSNYLDLQFFNIHISIGMPWHKSVLENIEHNYPMDGLNHCKKTNDTFTKWYHFHIGSYKDL